MSSDPSSVINAIKEISDILSTHDKLVNTVKVSNQIYKDKDWLEVWLIKKVYEYVRQNNDLNYQLLNIVKNSGTNYQEECELVTVNDVFKYAVELFLRSQKETK